MKAKTLGSGWHGQTIRHSNARKLGRAGGRYADRFYSVKGFSNMVVAKNKNLGEGLSELRVIHGDEDRTGRKIKYGEIFQEKNKNLKLLSQEEAMKKTLLKDSDGDGVPDHKDCQPNNPHAQDTYELRPIHDNRKSFYGKAKVETEADEEHLTKRLYSYGTLVAEIKDNKPIVHGTYSATTLRHIKEFLKQNGFKAETSKQLLKDYSPSKEETTEAIKEEEEKHKSMMKTTAMVAKLGEVFGKTTEEKNTWKKRMLKAGIPALEFPEDFDKLPEAEKERRLNAVIKQAEKKE